MVWLSVRWIDSTLDWLKLVQFDQERFLIDHGCSSFELRSSTLDLGVNQLLNRGVMLEPIIESAAELVHSGDQFWTNPPAVLHFNRNRNKEISFNHLKSKDLIPISEDRSCIRTLGPQRSSMKRNLEEIDKEEGLLGHFSEEGRSGLRGWFSMIGLITRAQIRARGKGRPCKGLLRVLMHL